MTPPIHTERDKHHRFPGEIISHGAWRYDGVHLSDRDVQALSCERGIDVTYEAIHPWCQKFGRDDANSGVAGDPAPGTHDLWHVDELVLTIHGERHDLWRAIDQDDHVREILVQRQHHTKAAKQCFRRLLKGLRGVPRVIMTDQLKRVHARYGQGWTTGNVATSIIGVSTPIGPRGHGSVACRGSHLPVKPSAFARHMDPWPNAFARDGMCCQHRHTATR
jgi:transposase-like protein